MSGCLAHPFHLPARRPCFLSRTPARLRRHHGGPLGHAGGPARARPAGRRRCSGVGRHATGRGRGGAQAQPGLPGGGARHGGGAGGAGSGWPAHARPPAAQGAQGAWRWEGCLPAWEGRCAGPELCRITPAPHRRRRPRLVRADRGAALGGEAAQPVQQRGGGAPALPARGGRGAAGAATRGPRAAGRGGGIRSGGRGPGARRRLEGHVRKRGG